MTLLAVNQLSISWRMPQNVRAVSCLHLEKQAIWANTLTKLQLSTAFEILILIHPIFLAGPPHFSTPHAQSSQKMLSFRLGKFLVVIISECTKCQCTLFIWFPNVIKVQGQLAILCMVLILVGVNTG